MANALDYYRAPGPMTTVDEGLHGWALRDVEAEPRALAEAIRGVLIHRDWAPHLGVHFDAARLADQHIRPTAAVLTRVLELCPEPLTVERPLPDRMVAVCRHFAVLHAALLRRAGVPARARAGFARYFDETWVDHWVTEWWDGRWVRHDAQIGPGARRVLGLAFDPSDQPRGEFLTGAEAWQLCRAGHADPETFGIFDQRGLWFVLADLLLDLAAINKVELLPWDALGVGVGAGPGWAPSPSELATIDGVAADIVRDELGAVRERYEVLSVPRQIISFIDGVPTPVDLGGLVDVPA